jgi:hypothetical protein
MDLDSIYELAHAFTLLSFCLCLLLAVSTGRAFAQSWSPLWLGWLACVPLAIAMRWLNFALFDQNLMDPSAFAVTLALTWMALTAAYISKRRQQMKIQYRWLDFDTQS